MQPKLADFLKIFQQANKVQKDYLIKKFKAMYSGKLIIEDTDDFRFTKISQLLHRVNGIIISNNNSLTH